MTIFGSPVVPDVELRNQRSRGPMRCSGPGVPSGGSTVSRTRRAGPLDEVLDFSCAGSRSDADGDEARLLAPQHHRVHGWSVGQLEARPGRRARTRSRRVAATRDDRSSYSRQVIDVPDVASTNAGSFGSLVCVTGDERGDRVGHRRRASGTGCRNNSDAFCHVMRRASRPVRPARVAAERAWLACRATTSRHAG